MRVPGGLIAMLAAAVLGAATAVAVLVVTGVVGESRVVERTVGVPQDDGSADARLAAVSAVAPAVLRVLPQRDAPGGSAVVILGDGTAVTALSVVGSAERVRVSGRGRTLRADVAGVVPALGIAVLRAGPEVGEPATLGGLEEPLPPGLPVIMVANTNGLGPQVSTGVVAAVRRETSTPVDALPEDAILTDAGDAPGAALAGERGDIIGVMVRRGVALPMNLAAQAARTVLEGGRVGVPYLGAVATDARDDPPAGTSEGAVVVAVRADSPAQDVLERGDTVIALGDRAVRDASGLADAVGDARPDDVVTITVIRGGERVTVETRLGTRPTEPADS